MSDTRKVVRVSSESEEAIKEYAEQKGIQVGEAADALISTGVSRLAALKRYSSTKKPTTPGKKKSAKKAKARGKAHANGAAAHA